MPDVKIVALEPQQMNYRCLVENIKRAGCEDRVLALNLGLSSDGRTMKIWFPNPLAAAAVEFRPAGAGESGTEMPLRTISVDQMFDRVAA